MNNRNRRGNITLRLTEDDHIRLSELAKITGLNRSELIRQLIRNATIIYRPGVAGTITIDRPESEASE